jgi:hypothetical protein
METKMKRCLVVFLAVCVLSAVATGLAGAGEVPAAKVWRVDTNKQLPPDEKSYNVVAYKGDLVHLSVQFSTQPAEALENLKVEIDGKCVDQIGVFLIPVMIRSTPKPNVTPTEAEDPHKKDLTCVLKGVKEGKATVKITPVGEDGKERQTRTVIVEVVEKKPKDK